MAPMVSTAAEAASFAAAVRAAGLPTAGVMVEVPAAALHADRLLAAVDFLSIGTNDLGQYTMAADRMSGDLAELLDPWQPAVLQLIGSCGAAGRAAGKPVGVCGEAAADPLLALVLAGLGMTSLSMTARSVPAVGAALAAHSLSQCQALAALALAAPIAGDARATSPPPPADPSRRSWSSQRRGAPPDVESTKIGGEGVGQRTMRTDEKAVDGRPERADGVREGDVQGRRQRLAGVHHEHRDLLGLGRVALGPVRVEDRPVAHEVRGAPSTVSSCSATCCRVCGG